MWFRRFRRRFKLIYTTKFDILPKSPLHFSVTKQQWDDIKTLRKLKGNISYEFYSCGGIGFGLKVHCQDNGEVIDFTDVNNW